MDPRVVRAIVYHPFLFAKRRMEDDNDDRPIRIKYFGVFVQKYIKTKNFLMGKRYKILIDNLSEVFEAVCSTGKYFEIENETDLASLLSEMKEQENNEGVAKVYSIWQEYIK